MIDIDKIPEGSLLIEIRGVYDGWSVVKYPDGTYANRWDKKLHHGRYEAAQKFIDSLVSGEDSL